ncbi:MAG: hypothetical protein KBA86_02460 [Bacteroidales bacterium]|nr:hypothetical protein [Bacteroidales bacterium]
MKKMILFFICVFIYIYSSFAQVSWSKGDGSQANPYQIESVVHLQYLAIQVNKGFSYENTFFILMNDLNLSSVCGNNIGGLAKDWVVIGNSKGVKFRGSFDGNKKIISNLFFADSNNLNYKGLFGYVIGVNIKDVTLTNVSVNNSNYVGAVCGYADSNTTISDCKVYGEMSAVGFGGGIVSMLMNSNLLHSENYINFQNAGFVGGLCWNVSTASVIESVNYGSFDSCWGAGGICSVIAYNAQIINSVNNGKITVIYSDGGGISALAADGIIKNCINNADIKTENCLIAGICAYLSHAQIVSCINYGDIITEYDDVGGIAAAGLGEIELCKNYGEISGNDYVGGMIGNLYGSVKHSYNYGNITGNYCVGGVAGAIQTFSNTIDSSRSCVEYSSNQGLVNAKKWGGGICGFIKGELSYCVNNSAIYADNFAGGICGYGFFATISSSVNSNQVLGNIYVGGICGSITDTSSVMYCVNTANVCGNENTGGICGSIGRYSSLMYSLNIGNVKDGLFSGAILGKIPSLPEMDIQDCYYDLQMCPLKYAVGNDNTLLTNAAKLTHELINNRLKTIFPDTSFSEEKWFFEKSLYPRPQGLDTNAAAIVVASPVFLDYSDDINSINFNFDVCLENNVTWKNSNSSVLSYNNGRFVILKAPAEDTILAFKNNVLYKSIAVNIVGYPIQGTEENPLTIESVEELVLFRDIINADTGLYKNVDISNGGFGQYFMITNDLNLDSVCGILNNDTVNWIPIGNQKHPFKGVLYGRNHTINNLFINHQTKKLKNKETSYSIAAETVSEEIYDKILSISVDSLYFGLFGYLSGAKIDSLHLANTDINGVYFVGSIAAFADSSSIAYCSNSGRLKGDYYVGGIVGRAVASDIYSCVNISDIQGYVAMGGICGDLRTHSELSFCLNSGNVIGSSANIGGISGIIDGSFLSYSINTGSVKAPSYVGAIVGNKKHASVFNCIYDKQTSLKKAIGQNKNKFGTDDDSAMVKGKLTLDLLGNALQTWINDSLEHWYYHQSMYPIPLGLESFDIAYIAAIPVFLQNNESVDSIYTDFKLGKGKINQAVTWETYDSLRVNIVDSMAFIACFTHKDTVSLSCAINDVVKNIYCKVSNSTEIPSKPWRIYGKDTIYEAGIYTYYIDSVKGATHYEWKCFDTSWATDNSNLSASLNIRDSGKYMLSVKAINVCGESDTIRKEIISFIDTKIYNFSLGQNIPNPVRTTCVIPFTLPQDGEINFQLINVFGQNLFDDVITAKKGNNYIEIDARTLANTIYYYAITYKGNCLVKKMCVEK